MDRVDIVVFAAYSTIANFIIGTALNGVRLWLDVRGQIRPRPGAGLTAWRIFIASVSLSAASFAAYFLAIFVATAAQASAAQIVFKSTGLALVFGATIGAVWGMLTLRFLLSHASAQGIAQPNEMQHG